MSKRQIIKVENVQYSENLAMRSVYCICSFLKPLVLEKISGVEYLSIPAVEFVSEETAIPGEAGLCKGLKREVVNPAVPYKKALIEYPVSTNSYADNYDVNDKVYTGGGALRGFELVEGNWSDFKSVKIYKPIKGITVYKEEKIIKPLVVADRGYGTGLDGKTTTSFASATGRYFLASNGAYYFEAYVIKNNKAFAYRATVSEHEYIPTKGEWKNGKYYFSASEEQDSHFNPPDTLWFKVNKSVGIEGVARDNNEITDEWLQQPVEDEFEDKQDKQKSNLILPALLVGLSLLGGR